MSIIVQFYVCDIYEHFYILLTISLVHNIVKLNENTNIE